MENMSLLQWMQDYLYQEIPITKEMGLQIRAFGPDALILKAPLDKNKNNKNTAFAGSQYSAAVLAGWCFLFLKLKEQNISNDLVVYQANITYSEPVEGDFEAKSDLLESEDLPRFISRLKDKGKARITLRIEIIENHVVKTIFEGIYAAKIKT